MTTENKTNTQATVLGVTSAPFEHSLEVFDAVDRGT
jgi:hypothetical protein